MEANQSSSFDTPYITGFTGHFNTDGTGANFSLPATDYDCDQILLPSSIEETSRTTSAHRQQVHASSALPETSREATTHPEASMFGPHPSYNAVSTTTGPQGDMLNLFMLEGLVAPICADWSAMDQSPPTKNIDSLDSFESVQTLQSTVLLQPPDR